MINSNDVPICNCLEVISIKIFSPIRPQVKQNDKVFLNLDSDLDQQNSGKFVDFIKRKLHKSQSDW